MLIVDDVAIRGMNEDVANYARMETNEDFVGVIDIKGFNVVRDSAKTLSAVCADIEKLYTKKRSA